MAVDVTAQESKLYPNLINLFGMIVKEVLGKDVHMPVEQRFLQGRPAVDRLLHTMNGQQNLDTRLALHPSLPAVGLTHTVSLSLSASLSLTLTLIPMMN